MTTINKISLLQEKLQRLEIDAFFSTNIENIRYLSGFSGSTAAIVILPEKSLFLTDFRYTEQASKETNGFELVEVKGLYKGLINELNRPGIKKIGFEGDHIHYSDYSMLKEGFLNCQTFVDIKGLVEELRMVKSPDELGFLRKAIEISRKAFSSVLPLIKSGIRELDVSLELEYALKKSGAEGLAFDIIVASGERGALPHGVASEKIINDGELVTIDFGAKYKGYHSDCTRTISVGSLNDEQKKIYNVVLAAHNQAIENLKEGVTAGFIDKCARDFISNAGYGNQFGHGTGHGVGLEVHEGPRIKENEELVLKSGMVITIEPGIYIPGVGGVRIEDMVLVNGEGCIIMSDSIPKETFIAKGD